MLNGSPVNVGDTVYILGIGTGKVVGTDESGGFSVQAGARGTLYYRDGGMVGNARRVYWPDPVFIDPPKDLNLWTAFMDSAKGLYSSIRNMLVRFNVVKG